MAWRGCTINWIKTEFIRPRNVTSPRCRFNRYTQQRYFRQEAKRPETKKSNVTKESKATPSEGSTPGAPKIPRPTLLKPLIFTLGFTGCSFSVAAILQYENLKLKVQAAKNEDKSEKLLQGSQDMAYWHNWWNRLTGFQKQLILVMSTVDDFWSSLTEGQKAVTGIIALNIAVLCCWRIPSLQRRMIKYFTSNPASKTQCLPMVLSTFSHYSVFHMIASMYVLWIFSSGIVSLLGKEQFLAVYTSAGVISTMVSYICKTATGRLYPSLGASGAVMAVLAAFCARMPEAELRIISLPMETFTAGNTLKAAIAIDVVGLVLGWRFLDHAAHLGGALFGIWYAAYGHKLIWRNREPLVKMWHNMRSGGGSRPGGGPGAGGNGGKPGP